ncbi:very short patch repair endonuclease [Mycolicibacterium neoaurum]|uniref:very short patch repair endonuclease n=1 Tax=Mycolicibacterium neoaurum TaxID=1795 RepID=UPI00248B3459|nr:very short patch repair endonuclease [Mycolicibacterium neoaurum]WBP93204.1 very short patch repair endonuclease [Mycolicibacterium neoaurum]WBS06829.1 very short patch repair endonuclease [Mycolicibacterium neoaurum]
MDGPDCKGTPATAETAAYITSPGRSRNMAAIRRRDTKPEVAVRSALHRSGYRFRKDYAIRLDGKLIRPDVAFTRQRVAVFIDGCFWHCCPEHGRQPGVNGEYWSLKLKGNVERDQRQAAALRNADWEVLRFWEHEDLTAILERVTLAVDTRRLA